MTRFTYSIALVAAVVGVVAASAAGATRPDDRALHGPGAIAAAVDGSIRPDDRPNHGPGALGDDTANAAAVRPDDRAWRGAGPEPTVQVVSSPLLRADGFDWADAGIGAAAAFGLGLLLAGGSLLLLRRQQITSFP